MQLHDITHQGLSVGRAEDGMVIFVQGGVPGDVADVMITRKRKGVWHGYVHQIIVESAFRTAPRCKHFGICGGCSWQNLAYVKQTEIKEGIVNSAMQRIAKVETATAEPMLPCEEPYYYRNKLEFTFSSRRWMLYEEKDLEGVNNRNALGFHRPGIFDKIVDVEECFLQNIISNEVRNALREFTIARGYSYYDVRNHEGLLRNLIMKTNEQNEVMAVLSFSQKDEEAMQAIRDFLTSHFKNIVSLWYAVNAKKNDSWHDVVCEKVYGDDFIYTRLDHVRFCIGPKSFFQTNRNQTERLYRLVEEYAGLSGTEVVYDLYCGVGSIGIYLAHKASAVLGIEEIKEAIDDAHVNATLNALSNCHFIAGDVLKILNEELIAQYGRPDVMIIDPPRTGIHPEVIEQILRMAPARIVYVSCNPSTAARDILLMSQAYHVDRYRPVDMFPMTNHIEVVTRLIIKQVE